MEALYFRTDQDYTNLIEALDRGKAFSIIRTQGDKYCVQIDNFFVWLFHTIKDPEYYLKQIKLTAEIMTQSLKSLAPPLPHDINNHRWKIAQPTENGLALKATREFLKIYSSQFKGSPLAQQNLAVKLGIPIKALDDSINPGFFNFVEKHRIDRYLLTYKVNGQSALRIDSATYEIYILMNGEYYKWKDALANLPPDPRKIEGRDYLQWMYGENGLQNKDMFQWTELKPYITENPHAWGNRYIFTYYAGGHGRSAQVQGSHCWLGLSNPQGEKITVGKYRMGGKPGRDWLWDIWKQPVKTVLANYQSPDCSNMWNSPFESIDFEISEESFYKIKDQIEKDKKQADDASVHPEEKMASASIFHNLYNCTDATNDYAKLSGVDLDVRVSYARLVSPVFLVKTIDAAYNYLPNVIIRIGEIVTAILFNGLELVLGANQISPDVLKRYPNIKVILSWKDLFNYEKTYLAHPWMVQQKFKEIREWREREIDKVKSLPNANELIDKIKYQLPEKFYI